MTAARRDLSLPGLIRGGPPVTLVALFGLLGFLLVTAGSSVTAARRVAEPQRARLAALIVSRRQQVDDLDTAVRQLRVRVAGAQAAAHRRTRGDAAFSTRLAALSSLAGTTPVSGDGLEVRLSDSPRAGTDTRGAYRIQDRDVQLVVNALFASGAVAVSVNDVRLVATSPIRAAGQTIVVSFRPLSPPYVVRAVGARRGLYDAGETARLYAHWRKVFGLGYRVREGTMRVPAYTGRVSLTSATPL